MEEVVEWAKFRKEKQITSPSYVQNYLEQKMIGMTHSRTAMNKEQFSELLTQIGLGGDENLIEKLFWVFDDDGNGEVDHKELGVGLEMLRKSSFTEKIDQFFHILDQDKSGTIDKREFYNAIKESIIEHNDKQTLKSLVNDIFSTAENKNGELTKEEL